eukprot:TRINITY_DN102195_c0_g1_i1.p1 TRINITY_DN102195_c0_g1~~TRINITY_DN102195_c0_g1_i1.p1  ORF type:complete len:263 (+),score=57.86 TRINITY_DN102195_c0_g1_i1:71-790(+)
MGANSSTCMTACADFKQAGVRWLGEPLESSEQGLPQNPPQRYENSESLAFASATSSMALAHQVPPLMVESAGQSDMNPASPYEDWQGYDAAYVDEMPEQSAEQAEQAQKTIAEFTNKMVKGTIIPVLATNGSTVDCMVCLDRKLRYLGIQRAHKKEAKKRSIPFEDVEKVAVGPELAQESQLPLDDFCICFLLREGQAIAFRIEDVEERDTFALILAMFADQRAAEVERKRSKAEGDEQ